MLQSNAQESPFNHLSEKKSFHESCTEHAVKHAVNS